MTTIDIKKWEIRSITAIVKDQDGSPVDLTIYDNVQFIMKYADWTEKVNAPWVFGADKTTGEVRYNFTAADVDDAKTFDAHFMLQISGVNKLAAPTLCFCININDC